MNKQTITQMPEQRTPKQQMPEKMPENWYDLLVDVCNVQSHYTNEKLMTLYLVSQILQLKLSYKIDAIGNIIVTKGKTKTYPCIVSHMDTVHKIVDDYKVFIDKKQRTLFAESNGKPTGIGGDDKCGVFSCLYFLETLPAIKSVFFTQEETGCKGSNDINMSFFDDCRYIIQLDRRDNSDFIDKKTSNKTISHEFSSEVGLLKKKYGFKSAYGSITDSINLWGKEVGISCVNISSGYYEPHSDNEYIKIDELWNSILFTEEIIKTLKPKRYISTKPVAQVSYPINKFTGKSYLSTNTSTNISANTSTWKTCVDCGKLKRVDFGQHIKGQFKCFSCLRQNDEFNMCFQCLKYCNTKDLKYNKKVRGLLCKQCSSTIDTKQVLVVCDICNKPFIESVMHLNVNIADEDFLAVCPDCYNDLKELVKDESSKTFYDICSVCGKQKPKKGGKYEDCEGLIFTCNDCIDNKDYNDYKGT